MKHDAVHQSVCKDNHNQSQILKYRIMDLEKIEALYNSLQVKSESDVK